MNKIIKLSKFINNHITNYCNTYSKLTRNKKTNIKDGIIFSLLYTQKNVSKDYITTTYNKLTNNTASRKAYYTRCNQITLKYTEKLYNDITEYINKNIYNKPKYNIYSCDGCKINTPNKLSDYGYNSNDSNNSCTVLTIAVYNIINGNLLNLYPVKHKDERLSFTENQWNIDNNSKNIFIFDRGFYSEKMIDHLESNNYNYIIRLKKNLKLITNNDNNKIRIVKYKIRNNEYYLATNLIDINEFPDNKLADLYHRRWRIEEYFKFIKNNCNFNVNNIKDDINFKKNIIYQLLISQLVDVISYTYNKHVKTDNKVINKKLIIDGLYNNFIINIINGKVNYNNLKKFCKSYIQKITTNKGKSIPIITKRPVYLSYYKYTKKIIKGDIT